MSKLAVLLLACLVSLSRLSAQADTTRPAVSSSAQPGQDSGIRTRAVRPHTPDSAIHHHSRRDSLRRDSIARQKAKQAKLVADSIAGTGTGAAAVTGGGVNAGGGGNGNAGDGKVGGAGGGADSLPGAFGGNGAAGVAGGGAGNGGGANGGGPGGGGQVGGQGGGMSAAALASWKKLLASNAYLDLRGRAVAEPAPIHQEVSKDSMFYLIVGILFLFALVRMSNEKYFSNLMALFFRVSLRQQQIREQVLQAPLPSLFLNLLFIISGGLFASFLLLYSRWGEGVSFWTLYGYCMLGLTAIYLGKFVVLKFCGWIFSISRATDTYIFVVFLVNKMLGIFLLPFLILIIFSGTETRQILITASLAIVFLLLIYRVLAGYRPIRTEIKLSPVMFFLYLCAFEIAPLLLIYKVLLTYLEKVY